MCVVCIYACVILSSRLSLGARKRLTPRSKGTRHGKMAPQIVWADRPRTLLSLVTSQPLPCHNPRHLSKPHPFCSYAGILGYSVLAGANRHIQVDR